MPRKTFLHQLYQKDRPVFVLILLFIIGQTFFTYKHVENTPFFHFGMYSSIHQPHQTYTVYNISVSENPVRSLDFHDSQRELVYNTIASYDGLKQLGFKDSLDKVISKRLSGPNASYARSVLLNNAQMDTPYQKWLFQYIADMRMIKTPLLEVSKQNVRYRPDGSVMVIDTAQTLFKLRYE